TAGSTRESFRRRRWRRSRQPRRIQSRREFAGSLTPGGHRRRRRLSRWLAKFETNWRKAPFRRLDSRQIVRQEACGREGRQLSRFLVGVFDPSVIHGGERFYQTLADFADLFEG